MPSDKRNLIMAKAMGLNFLLFNAVDVPFEYRLTSALLFVPFIFAHHEKCRFCSTQVMASIHNRNRL